MTVDEWNELYPEGTNVRYFPIKGYLDEYEDQLTRSKAFEDTNGHPVIFLQNKSGYVSLEHVTPLDQPQPKTKPHQAYPGTTDRPIIRSLCPPGERLRARARAACGGNKWAEENCKAVGNWD